MHVEVQSRTELSPGKIVWLIERAQPILAYLIAGPFNSIGMVRNDIRGTGGCRWRKGAYLSPGYLHCLTGDIPCFLDG